MLDSVVKKGIYHRAIPQDYIVTDIIHTKDNIIPFIAIADGCSAGVNTEVGAMILTQAALAVIKEHKDLPGKTLQSNILSWIQIKVKRVISDLNLSFENMLATLRIVYIVDNVVYTISTGDGFNFIIYNDKNYDLCQYEYETNAPYYLAYDMYNLIKEYDAINAESLVEKETTSRLTLISTRYHTSKTHIYSEYPLNDNHAYIGVATDGLASYARKESANDVIFPDNIVNQLSQIKVSTGEFLVRRFQKMDKELETKGYINYDDIGIAMISISEYKKAKSK